MNKKVDMYLQKKTFEILTRNRKELSSRIWRIYLEIKKLILKQMLFEKYFSNPTLSHYSSIYNPALNKVVFLERIIFKQLKKTLGKSILENIYVGT